MRLSIGWLAVVVWSAALCAEAHGQATVFQYLTLREMCHLDVMGSSQPTSSQVVLTRSGTSVKHSQWDQCVLQVQVLIRESGYPQVKGSEIWSPTLRLGPNPTSLLPGAISTDDPEGCSTVASRLWGEPPSCSPMIEGEKRNRLFRIVISACVATVSQIIVVHEHNATIETALKRTMRG